MIASHVSTSPGAHDVIVMPVSAATKRDSGSMDNVMAFAADAVTLGNSKPVAVGESNKDMLLWELLKAVELDEYYDRISASGLTGQLIMHNEVNDIRDLCEELGMTVSDRMKFLGHVKMSRLGVDAEIPSLDTITVEGDDGEPLTGEGV